MRRFIYTLVALVIAATGAAYADSIITGSKPFTFIPGTTISSSQVNADFDYIINQTNTNAAKNGANSSITSLLGLTTPIATNFGGTAIWTATTVGGTANAITVTATTPAISSYSLTKGNIVSLAPTATNTGAVTLNVNALGVVAVLKNTFGGLTPLLPGDLVLNQTYSVYYDGTQYVVLNATDGLGVRTAVTAAATTDIAQGSHFVIVSGSTGITSFGSNASLNNPIYVVQFSGAPLITNSANLVLPNGVNFQATGGDSLLMHYESAGTWRVLNAFHANQFPTVQRFTTGTGLTYTPTAGTRYIKVRMVAGGGGGGATTTNAGTNGTSSVFGGWGAVFGNGGSNGPTQGGGSGGAGGSTGTGTLVARITGGAGGPYYARDGTFEIGGVGGDTALGGGAIGPGGTGVAPFANTGGGGSGGASGTSTGGNGGGGGEYVEFYVNAPAATTYTVGTNGTGGAAGGAAGGNGAAGIIIVEEFN